MDSLEQTFTLTREQLEFVGGFVFGYFARVHDWEITYDDLLEVQRLVAQAIGSLNPLDEQNIESEIERLMEAL